MGKRPTIAVAVGLWILYTIVSVGLQASSGIPYADWFKTAANAWRTGVASLVAGSVMLVIAVAVLRWTFLWRDPVPLPVSGAMKATVVLWWIAIAVRLAGVAWDTVPMDLLLPIVLSGVLVGFAEETLFRGFFLRAMREGGRAEASAALWTAAAFGAFHLPNVFMGTGLVGLAQVVLAGLSGVLLYVFRRRYVSIVPAMVAHGAWDISTFLAGGYSRPGMDVAGLAMQLVFVVLAIVVIVGLARRDRRTVAIPAG